MKRLLFIVLAMIATITSFAQQKDVTSFLGIPVDGTVSSMKQKLVSKGFVPKKVGTNEFLEGEFNGQDVKVYIATNNNKVYRIMLADKNHVDEAQIKIRFNNLVKQFENNKRYYAFEDFSLSDKEDISYEMTVHNKIYAAYYLQDTVYENIEAEIQTAMEEKYSDEELKNPSETVKNDRKDIINKIVNYHFMKQVWFCIERYYGEYYICMFYDNEYNRSHGEDL